MIEKTIKFGKRKTQQIPRKVAQMTASSVETAIATSLHWKHLLPIHKQKVQNYTIKVRMSDRNNSIDSDKVSVVRKPLYRNRIWVDFESIEPGSARLFV